ncbi:MAG: bifunctional phosphopantothenoylcysteine decarboxylase/phosphopantothenate--cysteine ligase CoaBC [Phenylobacterium zucineum]|nr:MAG: bifunctional phosphopantothenoylcysteine decarboxylase/phosphopantothenate--cysteine ligase CoaBC [Phenylobacterium zucineum]
MRILLIVGGGIAAYKSLELIRLLRKSGIEVRVILTAAGAQFVTPLSLSALTGNPVCSDLFSLTDEAEMGHIQLSRAADLVVVAPATADLMAKAANGLANDLASTVLLATDKPVLMAPAMNVRMWENAATQRNLATLKGDGVSMIGPHDGDMACGEFGPGRMAEPAEIHAAILAGQATTPKPLAGRRAIVTAGPTIEPLDPVRYLTNRSSGKQGFAIASALAKRGAQVTLVAGPVALPTPAGVSRVDVETAQDMLAACQAALPADLAVCVAAVADWRPAQIAPRKTKKVSGNGSPVIHLTENPDILMALSRGDNRPTLVVGFAAETDNVEAYAQAKLIRKGCDWIIANDVSIAETMGGDHNAVSIVTTKGIERWTRLDKSEVADRLADRMAESLT